MTRLGENAFVSDQETFLTVDSDSAKKPLQKEGKENGQVNSPDSQATQLDAVEQKIRQKVAQTAEQTRTALSQHFVQFFERLLPMVESLTPVALINEIQAMPNGMKNNLNQKLGSFKTESDIKGPELRNAKQSFEEFRNRNHLIRPPNYLSLKNIILWFFVIIVTESVLNASLLWELTGILAALGQTVLITAVNVLVGACAVGLLLRCKNHVSRGVRWQSMICIPVVLVVLIFNFGVGHFRDALVEAQAQAEQLDTSVDWDDTDSKPIDLGFIDYTQKAMESIIASPLGIQSVLSSLFIIVGIGFFGFATYKWYSMFDRYPGYREHDRVLKKTHENYQKLLQTARAEIDWEIKSTEQHVSDESTKVMNIRVQYEDLNNRAQTLQTNYTDWVAVLETTQNYFLTLYRDSNRQVRSEPAPNHFNNEIPIDSALVEPPDFTPPELNLSNVAQIITTVREAKNEIRQIADDVWLRFNRLTDMQFETGEVAQNTP